jgi:hypothetical protein
MYLETLVGLKYDTNTLNTFLFRSDLNHKRFYELLHQYYVFFEVCYIYEKYRTNILLYQGSFIHPLKPKDQRTPVHMHLCYELLRMYIFRYVLMCADKRLRANTLQV